MKINIINEYIKLSKSISLLLFTENIWIGTILLFISFINPSSGALALLAFFSAQAFKIVSELSFPNVDSRFLLYNSLLVGLSIGYLFEISILTVIFTIILSIFTLLLSYSLTSILGYFLGLPILNLPFAITATLTYLSAMRYSNLLVSNSQVISNLDIKSLPMFLSGLFKSLGILVFLPYDIIGIVILTALLFFSRINFFLAIIGYYSGTIFLGLLKGSFVFVFADYYNFNFILIALSLGGFFLIPSIKSYIITIISVMISVFVLDAVNVFWSSFQIPVFTIPFVFTVLLVLYTLKIAGYPFITKLHLGTPEKNLQHYMNYTARFKDMLPQPLLPVSGEWTVYQEFDDEWTHKGAWKEAYDFVVKDKTTTKTYRNEGKILSDYYCFNKPIFAPVTGVVISQLDTLPDNPVGDVDHDNNWGNYIIIKSDFGYFVEISHLLNGSISVKTGETVYAGQQIAMCGNSGYSPEPHLHIQCQKYDYIGSPTIPFDFTNIIVDDHFSLNGEKLKRNEVVKSLIPSRTIDNKLLFILDDKFKYKLFKNGRKFSINEVVVKMNSSGNYFFYDNSTDTSLYFYKQDGKFRFTTFIGSKYSILRFFFIAAPTIPLTEEEIFWKDDINNNLCQTNNIIQSFLKSFNHSLYKTSGEYSLKKRNTIIGKITQKTLTSQNELTSKATLSDFKGFSEIMVTMNDDIWELKIETF